MCLLVLFFLIVSTNLPSADVRLSEIFWLSLGALYKAGMMLAVLQSSYTGAVLKVSHAAVSSMSSLKTLL